MNHLTIAVLALVALTGCVSLHADLPEEMVRHIAREDGVDLGALCSNEGRKFSEGAVICMADQRMTCSSTGRWVQEDTC